MAYSFFLCLNNVRVFLFYSNIDILLCKWYYLPRCLGVIVTMIFIRINCITKKDRHTMTDQITPQIIQRHHRILGNWFAKIISTEEVEFK